MTAVSDISGLILVDKPEGMTSFSVVSRIRRILGIKKAGHAGTLDPFATGLLTIAAGQSTRVLRYLEHDGKTYRATMGLGRITSTGDIEGETIGGRIPDDTERNALSETNYQQIKDAISSMVGEITQVPSAYSAIKIAGRPAYDYARKGQEVEIPSRKVTIHEILVHRIWEEEGEIRVDMTVSCSKGTYIRTLCEDIGQKLGWGGYCVALRRILSGAFDIENAYTLEAIEEMVKAGDRAFLMDEKEALSSLPSIVVSEREARDLRNGKKLDFYIFKDRMETIVEQDPDARVLALWEDRPVAVIYVEDQEGETLIREERVFA